MCHRSYSNYHEKYTLDAALNVSFPESRINIILTHFVNTTVFGVEEVSDNAVK